MFLYSDIILRIWLAMSMFVSLRWLASISLTAEFVNAADGRKSLFDRQHYLRDHLFRLSAGQEHADEDSRGIGLREEIDSQVAEREYSEHDQKADEHYRKDGALNANFSQSHFITRGKNDEGSGEWEWGMGIKKPAFLSPFPTPVCSVILS